MVWNGLGDSMEWMGKDGKERYYCLFYVSGNSLDVEGGKRTRGERGGEGRRKGI
jgi:hypothetical protein